MKAKRDAEDFSAVVEVLDHIKELQHHDLKAAIELATEALVHFSTERDSEDFRRLELRLAHLTYLTGDPEPFVKIAETFVDPRHREEKRLQAESHGLLGIYYQNQDKPLQAMDHYRDASRLYRLLMDRIGMIKNLISQATCHRDLREFRFARNLLESVQDGIQGEPGMERLHICAVLELGRLSYATGDYAMAVLRLGDALHIPGVVEFPNVLGDIYRELARIYQTEDHCHISQAFLEAAIAIYQENGYVGKAQSLREEFAAEAA